MGGIDECTCAFVYMVVVGGYAIKSTLGHKAGKTTHRELKSIGFASVFDCASESSKRHELEMTCGSWSVLVLGLFFDCTCFGPEYT